MYVMGVYECGHIAFMHGKDRENVRGRVCTVKAQQLLKDI
jgi:hypothetical protein